MALKRRKAKQSGLKPAKKKPTEKKSVTAEEGVIQEEDDDLDDDGFDDMEEIPLDTKWAVSDTPHQQAAAPASEQIQHVTNGQDSKGRKQEASSNAKPRKDLYKPPTSKELNALRETENLFHSNLFKMQAEEMLEEIMIKNKRKTEIEEWIGKIQETINAVSSSDKHPVSESAWLSKMNIKCPFDSKFNDPKVTFRYVKPRKITPVGSWAFNMASKGCRVDILVEIPPECWQKGDHADYRYHRKRALYLSYLAGHLQMNTMLVQDISFESFGGDFSRPVLVIQPAGKLNGKVSFCILAAASEDFVSVKELLPKKCCIAQTDAKLSECQPTPLYNASVLADMRIPDINRDTADKLASMRNVLNARLLLHMWHRHRQLDGTVNMFILTEFLTYLVNTKKLNAKMSIYQVLRTFWLQLARTDWSKEGITLRQQSGPASSAVADAHASFPVVFLDATETLNICAHVSQAAYDWLRWEANLAIGLLNKTSVNSFAVLFITPKPFVLSFENVIIFNDLQSAGQEDSQHYWPLSTIEKIHQCFAKGLDQRMKMIACKTMPASPWPVTEDPPSKKTRLAFGLHFNAPFVWEVMDKGPAADSPESAEFRAFWGEKSQLRRFQDGFICEAVHWPAKNWAQRRLICRQVITYLIDNRLKLGRDYVYVADQLDDLLAIPKLEDAEGYGTGEEASLAALEALDGLTKHIRSLEDLPLPVATTQGVAATFRHAEPFPPLPQIPQGSYKLFGQDRGCLLPTAEMTPMYMPSLTVLLTLQTSGKWPDDLEAVRRIKAAFYVQLASKLHQHFELVSRTFPDHVIVEYKGYVFKLIIAYHRDITLLKRLVEPNGIVKYRDNPESLRLERDHEITPKLSSALRALQSEQPAFSSAVRLAKRWVASHMLLDYVDEEVIEMMVASLFVDSTIYGTPPSATEARNRGEIDWTGPLSPQVAFLRFLQLVAYFEWSFQPLVINFNGGLSKEALREAETAVSSLNPRPALVLITPYDPSGVAFTRQHRPPLPVWSRLMLLARESLKLLENQLVLQPNQTQVDVVQAFRPPLDSYDAVINLKRGAVGRRLYTLDAPFDKKLKPFSSDKRTRKLLPVYDYDPVDRLLHELRAAYEDKARFFYDRYGGTVIGVMWVNKAWSTPTEFKVSLVNGCCLVDPSTSGGEKRLAPNLEAICQDFLVMGRGLVNSVRTGSVVWQDNQS